MIKTCSTCRVLSTYLLVAVSMTASGDDRLEGSREITRTFGEVLRTVLTRSMSDDGPVAAISVCKVVAPEIASRLSDEHKARIGRTSLKARNPDATPDPWQKTQLSAFDQRREAGEPVSAIEKYVANPDGSARYLKAIPVEQPCLVCHGTALSADVIKALDANYPGDSARGYQKGELRGAFFVDWEAPGSEAPGSEAPGSE